MPIVPAKPPPPKRDKNGKPVSILGAAPKLPETDKELLKLLQSATIMNGGKENDDGRTTVRDVLQRIGIGKGGDGVMMYPPLIPARQMSWSWPRSHRCIMRRSYPRMGPLMLHKLDDLVQCRSR